MSFPEVDEKYIFPMLIEMEENLERILRCGGLTETEFRLVTAIVVLNKILQTKLKD